MLNVQYANLLEDDMKETDAQIFTPILRKPGKGFYLLVLVLVALIGWAFFAWIQQLLYGQAITGLNRPVYWGIYITNFIFFIGISHAGTLISAILRITQAEWRRPITRAAEAITVFALMVGPINIVFDLGRPDRAYYIIPFLWYGRYESPLLWDFTCINLYLLASITYLYLPLIPDIAMVRDRLDRKDWRWKWYNRLALGWQGTEKQKQRLEKIIGAMAVIIIPIAVSVHTVVSWVPAMTVQPMWHSTIFGPYFVVGAIFSGIASIIITMAILRRVFRLEAYLKLLHFNYLGLLLLTMTCLWFYFTFAEYLTTFYGQEPTHMRVFNAKVHGEYSLLFWTMAFFCFVIPFFILAIKRTRTVAGTVIASILINIGMWIERYTILIPTLIHPRIPYPRGTYVPSWVEVSITIGLFAGFVLLYVLFSRFFPVVSVWETRIELREN
jgi:molybdopterin-containing oxidoreductase family membrane subunit